MASSPFNFDNLYKINASFFGRFSLSLLESMIAARGVKVSWQKGIICACRAETGQPDPMCSECRGFGFTYDLGTELVCLVTSREWNESQYGQQGTVEEGTVNITFPMGIQPGINDKFVSCDEVVVYNNEVLVRGETAPNGEPLERLLASTVIDVERIIVNRRVPVNPPATVPYTTKNTDFYPTQNFVISDGNLITWMGTPPSGAPSTGEVYTIRYKARPEYIAFDSGPRFRQNSDQILPQFVRARRIDFIKRQKANQDG